jgi:predicted amidohydrolase YtcJ
VTFSRSALILSADIMKIPVAEILKTRCVMTVINGEIVYESKPQKGT